MLKFGTVIKPTLVVKGKVKSKGILSSKSMIRKWLEKERV